ncbi:MAG: 30S ribosomal protein S12 methylthiotransferase RimO [Pseudomonadota bacterium]
MNYLASVPGRIGFVSLGCAKATVDSERILSELRVRGYEMVNDYEAADMVIVNTCGFIDDAVEESLEAIGEAVDENGKVIVTGCLGARAEVIESEFSDLLAVTGPHATDDVISAVVEHLPPVHDPRVDLVPPGGLKLTPRHYAYLKISEGCNHRCSFCIIPQMRGDLVSRTAPDVMAEAEALVNAGVSELLVVSQDTSAYGVDLKYKTGFHGMRPIRTHIQDLCEALSTLGVWVRLHYVYPYPHVDKLVPLMAEEKILPYLDIPFQHSSPGILKAMKRPAHSEKVLKRIRNWREICPELTIRSTFIVGFPGETEDDFLHLLAFIEEAQIDRAGCFAYSNVDGAPANNFENDVPEEVRQERLSRFMEAQEKVSADRLCAKVGQYMPVIIDGYEDGVAIARTRGDAPEVDGIVEVDHLDESLPPGTVIEVEITGATHHDLTAIPA